MQQVQRFPLSTFDVAQQLFNNSLWSSNNRTSQGVTSSASNRNWMPAVDITEQEKQFLVVADVPGLNAEDIDISVDKRVLTISGQRKKNEASIEDGYSRIERHNGNFERRFTLPETVELDSISAKVENGLLTLTIQKSEDAAVRKITVQG